MPSESLIMQVKNNVRLKMKFKSISMIRFNKTCVRYSQIENYWIVYISTLRGAFKCILFVLETKSRCWKILWNTMFHVSTCCVNVFRTLKTAFLNSIPIKRCLKEIPRGAESARETESFPVRQFFSQKFPPRKIQ